NRKSASGRTSGANTGSAAQQPSVESGKKQSPAAGDNKSDDKIASAAQAPSPSAGSGGEKDTALKTLDPSAGTPVPPTASPVVSPVTPASTPSPAPTPVKVEPEICPSSKKIAFVTCEMGMTIQPGANKIDMLDCEKVKGTPDVLKTYDTIVYFGVNSPLTRALEVEVERLLNERLIAGTKIIVLANSDNHNPLAEFSKTISVAFPNMSFDSLTISQREENTTTKAFVAEKYKSMNVSKMYSTDKEWCGDLFFEKLNEYLSPLYSGTFHAYLKNTAARKGVLFYVGIDYKGAKNIDFSDPFLSSHFDLKWDGSGSLARECELACKSTVGHGIGKPVIYFYPKKEKTKVSVRLDFKGELVTTYPKFDEKTGGWDIIANPDGKITSAADNQEYSYIFWNGTSSVFQPEFKEGFVVKGKDTRKFLQKVLAEQGMKPAEYNEMIVYWLPYMEHHSYNLIHFAGESYTEVAKMKITPAPDSLLRVFMVFKEIKAPIEIKQQKFAPFMRKGFSVVEWGGSEINGDWHVIK
ncbi:MAG: hypothetical protein HQK54_18620, partial [Oligoflexales bacterium]|nr:hypothetical protein [Oligoflexales bacterium]